MASRGTVVDWKKGLINQMKNPALVYLQKEDHLVMKDKFPKARHHFLILPLEELENLGDLRARHVELVRTMRDTGLDIAEEFPRVKFRMGFHAVPHMARLHLHLISQDFDSPCLKSVKHWNNFNTPYSVEPEEVIDQLLDKGSFTLPEAGDVEKWLNRPLKCHKCDKHFGFDINFLKSHLRRH